mgnify:FL=1|tara:strand:- start:645 stop:1556 length:912 start_codon:yes stop_codon:yes gene_type:complete
MYKKVILNILLFSILGVSAQSKIKKDRNAIKEMCGCFEVTFNFSETIKLNEIKDYKPSPDYRTAPVYELAVPIVDEKDYISIQHILQVGDEDNIAVVKHWRQDWIYQNRNLYFYDVSNNWTYYNFSKTDVRGQWTQKVFQVDDSPRYEGKSTWIHVDGKSFWENKTPAPLPRREFSKRKDYNVLMRTNRHEITDYGWFHGQNNEKIKKTLGEEDQSLAYEVGYNYYKRVEDDKCKVAKDWWINNQDKWQIVRNVWKDIYNLNNDLSLKSKFNGKRLYEYLLFSNDYNEFSEIKELIYSFVINK